MEKILEKIAYFDMQLKLNHWQSESGWHHEKIGELYTVQNSFFDAIVEGLQGNTEKILLISENLYSLVNYQPMDIYFKSITDFLKELKKSNPEVLGNMVDDYMDSINKYKYLISRK